MKQLPIFFSPLGSELLFLRGDTLCSAVLAECKSKLKVSQVTARLTAGWQCRNAIFER